MRSRKVSGGNFIIGSATDAGRIRKNNEDSYAVFDAEWQDDIRLAMIKVAVVADGIGGSNAGELASRIAVEKVTSVMQRRATTPIPDRLEQAVLAANQDIYDAALSNPSARGMGTTIVMAAIVNNTLYVVHAGDSRVYLVRNGKISRLTLDHTWVQEAIDMGRLTPEAARLHPNRNVIKRFLGAEQTITVDHKMIDIARAEPGGDSLEQWPMVDRMPLQPGDTVLLCSDGLTDELKDSELQDDVSNHNPEKAAQRLVAKANVRGGRDNITVTLLRLPGGTGEPAS